MKFQEHITTLRRATLLLSALSLCACGALRPSAAAPPSFYTLDYPATALPKPEPNAGLASKLTLIVNPTHAGSGFDSPRIIYVRQAHKLEYFANSEWVDPPARMLGPLLVAAIQRTQFFGAVVLMPAAAGGDLRMDTELVRLQHDFRTRPSHVDFTLRAYLVNDKTRRVLGWCEFSAKADALSDDPPGGVIAANLAIDDVLNQLANFLTFKASTPACARPTL